MNNEFKIGDIIRSSMRWNYFKINNIVDNKCYCERVKDSFFGEPKGEKVVINFKSDKNYCLIIKKPSYL